MYGMTIKCLTTQQTIQVISFFTLHNFFYIIYYFCEHVKGFLQNITSFCLLGIQFMG